MIDLATLVEKEGGRVSVAVLCSLCTAAARVRAPAVPRLHVHLVSMLVLAGFLRVLWFPLVSKTGLSSLIIYIVYKY